MDPVSHGALAYLLYVACVGMRGVISETVRTRRVPAKWALVPLAIGSQFPDLVDKPLAYWGLLVSGRSLAHSVFSLAVVGVAVGIVIHDDSAGIASRLPTRLQATVPAAFVIGYGAHLLGDAYHGLFAGEFFSVRFLVYPLYPLSPYSGDAIAPWVRVLDIYRDPAAAIHVEVVATALLVFVGLRVWRHTRGRVSE
jgi:hypothetical protein